MTSLSSLLSQLSEYGFNTSEGIQPWTSQDIATTMGSYFGQQEGLDNPMSEAEISEAFLPAMFSSLSPEAIKQSSISHYSPLIQSSQSTLLTDLIKGIGGKKAKAARGGFAGSGGWEKHKAGVRDVYGKSMGQELQKAFSSRGQSLQGIQDLINQWAEHAREIAPSPEFGE